MAMSAPAWASANISCRIDDKFLSFALEAIAGRSGPIVQVQSGTMTIKPAVGKLAAPQLAFGREHIIQQWDYADEMRLQIEVGNEAAHQTVMLVILARRDKNADKYSGRYVLTISTRAGSKEVNGRIKSCEAG